MYEYLPTANKSATIFGRALVGTLKYYIYVFLILNVSGFETLPALRNPQQPEPNFHSIKF